MAQTFPVAIKNLMRASGGPAPISLVELQTVAGARFFLAEHRVYAPSYLSSFDPAPPATVLYQPWLVGAPQIHSYRSLNTATGTIAIQNLSGDTVRRDGSRIFAANELFGALVFVRLWREDAEFALHSFLGSVLDPEVDDDGQTMTLPVESCANWSAIRAPYMKCGPTCELTFGSVACGSTSPTPCNNNYGTCSSLERFPGLLLQWTGGATNYDQVAQPLPGKSYNAVVGS